MRTVLNILNFVLGGFATTLDWLAATAFSVLLIFTLPLTRSCWEITKLSFLPFGNEAIYVDELYPGKNNALLSAGSSLLNVVWLLLSAGGWAYHTLPLASCSTYPLSVSRSASPISKSLPSPCGR